MRPSRALATFTPAIAAASYSCSINRKNGRNTAKRPRNAHATRFDTMSAYQITQSKQRPDHRADDGGEHGGRRGQRRPNAAHRDPRPRMAPRLNDVHQHVRADEGQRQPTIPRVVEDLLADRFSDAMASHRVDERVDLLSRERSHRAWRGRVRRLPARSVGGRVSGHLRNRFAEAGLKNRAVRDVNHPEAIVGLGLALRVVQEAVRMPAPDECLELSLHLVERRARLKTENGVGAAELVGHVAGFRWSA